MLSVAFTPPEKSYIVKKRRGVRGNPGFVCCVLSVCFLTVGMSCVSMLGCLLL